MKTEPMKHQARIQSVLAEKEYYALGWEQGTGKTWGLLADMEGRISDGVLNYLVVAPKGVHTNWVLREIPAHFEAVHVAQYYVSGAGKKKMAGIDKVVQCKDPKVAAVLAINIDALNTPTGYHIAAKFLRQRTSAMIIDESSRIKNGGAARTKKTIKLGGLAEVRRIASGTMISNGPPDLFSQFEFLKPGGQLLGTRSYRAFVAEFAEVLPDDNNLMRHIQKHSKSGRKPQIVAKHPDGTPKWRNLDKLRALMKPHYDRVLKKDCLDLPPKIYTTRFFELTPKQRKAYELVDQELRYELDNGDIDTFTALTRIGKLRQVTSGFINIEGEAQELLPLKENPRLQLFQEIVEDIEGQFIVWAHYQQEIAAICSILRDMGVSVVEYHGKVRNSARERAVDDFQAGAVRVFVGQPQSGGIGLTLTAATTSVYYSNDFALEPRLQSEDRNHRKGTTQKVLYIDIAGANTLDERIAQALQRKEDVATAVLNH